MSVYPQQQAHQGHQVHPGYSLVWHDYEDSLAKAFDDLRNDEDFVDVALGCQGRKFGAHKTLLSACSPYFRTLLKNNPCQHPVILIRDTQWQDLESILAFIYNGQVRINENQLDSFLKAAQEFQIRGLTQPLSPPTLHHQQQQQLQPQAPHVPANVPIMEPSITTLLMEHQQKNLLQTKNLNSNETNEFVEMTSSSQNVPRNKKRKKELRRTANDLAEGMFKQEEQFLSVEHPAVANLGLENKKSRYEFERDEVDNNKGGGEEPQQPEYEIGQQQGVNVQPEIEVDVTHSDVENNDEDEASPGGRSKEKTLKCYDCEKLFTTRNALLDHEHLHKGNTTCPECGRILSTRGNLKQHLYKKHRIRMA